MMPYKEWRDGILRAAQNIASRQFQEQAWPAGGELVSSPDEVYLALMEDFTADLFFETYSNKFTQDQMRRWKEFRSLLEDYYDKMPRYPDPRAVLEDAGWELVRQAAQRFLQGFEGN
jgi:hypothetical protein